MPAGSIIVDLLMRTGSFVTDTDRAAKRLQKFGQEVGDVAVRVATGAGVIAASIAAAISVVDRLAGGIAQYQDLADKIGDSASRVSTLQLAADQSETSLDNVASASARLTAALSKTDEESDATARALAAINIPLKEFKSLSPVEQLQRVASELSKFETGAGKTAVAVALFGKAGADLLPFLNDLADAQSKNVGLTDEQIRAADEFTKDVATLRSGLSTLGKSVVADLLPPFQAVVDYFKNSTTGATALSIAGDVVKTVFQALAVVAANVVFVFQGIGREIGAIGAQGAALLRGDFEGFRAISDAVKEDGVRARAELDRFEKTVLGIGQPDFSRDNQSSAEARRLGLTRPALNFKGTPPPKPKADKDSEADKYLKSLQDQLDRTNELSAVELLLANRQRGRLGDVGVLQFEVLRGYAEEIDANKRRQDQADAEKKQLADLIAGRKELLDEAQRFYEATRTPQEVLNLALAEQSRLLKALGPQYQDTYNRATAAAIKAFEATDEGLKNTKEFAKELGATFSSAAEDAIVNFGKLRDVLQGVLQDIIRIAVRRTITNPLANAIGGFDIGKFVSSFKDYGEGTAYAAFAGSGANGVDVMAGREYLVGEDGPERFRPRSAGAIIPNKGGGNVIVNNYGADVRTERRGNDTLVWINAAAEAAYGRVAADLASGTGRVSSAMKSRGVNLDRALPRRT